MPSVASQAEAAPPASSFYRTGVLGLSAGLSLLFGIATAFLPALALTIPLGLFVILFAPGYGLGSLLFRKDSRLHWTANFAVVVGLSVVLNVVLGLILLALHLGLPGLVFAVAALAVDVAGLLVRQATSPVRVTAPSVSWLPAALSLPNYSRAQRGVAYFLLGAIVVVLAVSVYLATTFPSNPGQVSLGATGPGGTGPLPGFATHCSSTNCTPSAIDVLVGNNASGQQFRLVVVSVIGSPSMPPPRQAVPWALPLPLGSNTTSSLNFTLAPGASTTFPVTFYYSLADSYTITILLETSSGAVLRTLAFAFAVL